MIERLLNIFNKDNEISTNDIFVGKLDVELPKEAKDENIYFYKWLKADGDWVDENKPLYRLRIGEEKTFVKMSQPFVSKKSGILQHIKKVDDLLKNGDELYIIHPINSYSKENLNTNSSYSYFFDRYIYNIPENFTKNKLKIKEWLKKDGCNVKKGEVIFSIEISNSKNQDLCFYHYAEKDGFLDIETYELDYSEQQNKLIYIIHENDLDRVKRKFFFKPEIIVDEFSRNKIIKWSQVALNTGYSSGVISYSQDNKIHFSFSFNNINGKDYLVIQFEPNQFLLSKNDSIAFLFDNQEVALFKFETSSYKVHHPYIDKYFENEALITLEDLELFKNQKFNKWKLRFDKSNNEIIGGYNGYFNYKEHENLALVINKFANEYCTIVKNEINEYIPTYRNNNAINENLENEHCFVYLMIDTVNSYYKIGISNKPDWREKTLQSEKPSIELLASKKFIKRKIAMSFEKALHETYSEKRIRGEWFKLDSNEVQEIIVTLNE